MIADGNELITLISEIRSQYNCFDSADQKYYEALSMVLRILRHLPSEQPCEDAVSRAQAIAAVSNWLYDRDDGRSVDQLLSTLPSVQPKRTGKRTETHGVCLDVIDRQAAIDALSTPHGILYPIRTIESLPSTQPQIIHCADCRYQDKGSNESGSWNLCGYRPWLHVPTEDEHYCGYAERRTE